MAAQPLWAADALWALPPSPYVNHTPRADAYEKAKWALVGLTLFVPRLILALLTSACRREAADAAQRERQRRRVAAVALR
jgi:hypothetical protein